jgi:hypothetical protein
MPTIAAYNMMPMKLSKERKYGELIEKNTIIRTYAKIRGRKSMFLIFENILWNVIL